MDNKNVKSKWNARNVKNKKKIVNKNVKCEQNTKNAKIQNLKKKNNCKK